MTYEEKRAYLSESIKLLTTHEPFQRFMDGVVQLQLSAIRDSVRMDVVDNPYKVAAALGEVRAYLDIQDMVMEFSQKSLE